MPQSPERSEDEVVGARLRMFRERICKMSRTAFALSLGIGSERLASYESGRAPVRLELFQRLNREYFINPQWLATGEGAPRFSVPLEGSDYAQFIALETPRALFLDVYRSAISHYLDMEAMRMSMEVESFIRAAEALEQRATTATVALPGSTRLKLRRVIDALEKVLAATESLRKSEAEAVRSAAVKHAETPGAYLGEKKTLVDKQNSLIHNSATDMKTRWRDYQKKLKELCKTRGTKAAIAKKLKVSRTMVSKWVAGSEPTADFAFALIEWIDKHWKAG